ncbi:MAG: DUF2135 domain-containing protein [Endomicrobia bacterium]|nr:DUF2135 domain-containing protein [Endomicrobiia bacterium]
MKKKLSFKILACLIAVVMFSGPVFAQSGFQSLKRGGSSQNDEIAVMPMPMPRPVPVPRIVVSPDRKPINLQDLKIDVEIIGNLAMTTYEMVFHNPNQMVMEGEFEFPLTENQNVSAIALDINGKMRDGVVVEKQKAREAFEAIVRRGVDPALVEKTSDNQFKMRIYPFSPNGTRRIRVTIEEPLITRDNNYIYNLPLRFNQQVNFDLNVEIPANAVASMPKTDTDLSKFAFSKINNVFKASFSQRNYLLDNQISFTLPKLKEEPVFMHKDNNETYFYSDINIQPSSKDKTLPKRIAVVWDTSLSSSKRNLAAEIALLDAYFKNFSNVDVAFATFNIKTDINKSFTVKNGNWDALRKEIEELIYDGATRFDKLNLNSLKVDEILLFTDGVSTFGNTQIEESNTPVFVITSSPEFNRGGLMNAAVKSGGSFINLNAVTAKEALTLLTKQNLKLIAYEFDKNKFRDIYPKPGVDVGENFTFAGILTAQSGEITLSFGYNKKEIVQTKKINIKAEGDNPAVARLWAVQKIKDLEMDSEKNEKEISKLGQEYSVVTEFTSLLVLEFVQDYVTYKITPPQELLAEYNRITANARKGEEQTEKSALDDAISQAREIKEWWKREFDQSKPPKSFEKLKGGGEVNRLQESNAAMDAAPMPSVRQEASVSRDRDAAPRRANAASKVARSRAASADFAMADMAVAESDKAEVSRASEQKSAATIQIKAWDPQTPYMKILKKSNDQEIYRDYLKLKSGYDDQPSFFFDVTDEFIHRKMNDKAVVILSNIAEMKLDNAELLRTVANKLMELGEYQYAVDMFEKIVKLRGEHPQSYRDLALAYQANKEYQKSLDTFYIVMTRTWSRFNSIKQIVFVEMNNLIALSPKLDTSKINKELIFAMPVDIRVVLGWSTDNTDIDLHVKDPYGETAYYGNRLTRIGGRVSQDITDGFGPEEFMLRKAVNGDYEIFTNNFGDRRQSISGPTVLYLDIFTFYGTKKQTHQRILVRTENVKENNIIGTVNFK